MQRRTFGMAVLGSIGVGSLGFMASQPASGQVSIDDYSIPDFDKEVTEPVSKAELTVSGNYSITSDVVPDKLILRLEAKQGLDYIQIAATAVTDNLSREVSGSYKLVDNLFDADVTPIDLNPATVGESTTTDVDTRVSLTVQKDGREIGRYSAEDRFTITVTKTTGETTIQMGGTGSLSVS